MNKLCLTALSSLFFCSLSYAQTAQVPTEVPVVVNKVNYSRAVPRGLKAFLPRGGKSLFWGQSDLTYQGKKVWIHLYDAQKPRVQNGDEADDLPHRLDLFVFSAPKKLKRISSATFPEADYSGQSFGVRTLWLDPERRTMPIIEVALQDPNGLYGMITNYAICVYNQGLKEKPVIEERFGKGDSNAADWSSWNTKFATTDDGLTGITFYQGSSAGSRNTFFRWEKNHFEAFHRTQQQDMSGPYEEVPFDSPLWGYE